MVSSEQELVAIYTRVSTDTQAEGYSLSQQVEFLKSCCEKRNWRYVRVYCEVDSGAKWDRDKFRLMLEHAEMGLFSVILVYRLDRVSRSTIDLQILLQFLKSYQVQLVSATENFDSTTLNGKLMFDLISSIAEWERGLIRQRTMAGARARAERGLFRGGLPPLGYRYDKELGILVIDEIQARTVREIFEQYIRRKSTRKVAAFLEFQKIPTKKGKHRWGSATISIILRRKMYSTGKMFSCGVEVEVPKIIDRNTFEEAQRVLNERRILSPKNKEIKEIYTNDISFCPNCGSGIRFDEIQCPHCMFDMRRMVIIDN